MPELSGLDFLRELRQHDLDVPVILMTAGATLDSALDAIEYGAQQYLLKPVEPEALVQSVGRAAALGELARAQAHGARRCTRGKALPYGDRATLEAVLTRTFATIHAEFQPIVSMRKKRLIGYEAFLRCDETLFASYDALLVAAERVGWRTALSRTHLPAHRAGLRRPARRRAALREHPSARRAGSAARRRRGAARADRRQRGPRRQRERAGRAARRAGRARCRSLRGAGFRIAIDNVGTGPSGLDDLQRLSPGLREARPDAATPASTRIRSRQKVVARCTRCSVAWSAADRRGSRDRGGARRAEALGADLAQGTSSARRHRRSRRPPSSRAPFGSARARDHVRLRGPTPECPELPARPTHRPLSDEETAFRDAVADVRER